MDENAMIDDLIRQLDGGMSKEVGHVNVDVNSLTAGKNVETMGCADCSSNPLACSVPTLHEGLDGEEQTVTNFPNNVTLHNVTLQIMN